MTKIFSIFNFTGISLSHIMDIPEVKETTPKPCIFYIINFLLYIISWKVRHIWVHLCTYVGYRRWAISLHVTRFFKMLLKRPWTRLTNMIQKVCYFSWLHMTLTTEFPLLMLIFIAFVLQLEWISFLICSLLDPYHSL